MYLRSSRSRCTYFRRDKEEFKTMNKVLLELKREGSEWTRTKDYLCPHCDCRKGNLLESGMFICHKCSRHFNIKMEIKKGNTAFIHKDFVLDLKLHGHRELADMLQNIHRNQLELNRNIL